MRNRNLRAVLATVAALGVAGGAGATSLFAPLIAGNTVDLIWTASSNPGGVHAGLGTSNITLENAVEGPHTLTLAVVQTVSGAADGSFSGTNSLGGIFGAVAFDSDLGNELNGPGTLDEAGGALPDPTGSGFFKPSTPGYDDPVIMPKKRDSTGLVSGYGLGLDVINAGAAVMVAGPTGTTFTAFTVTFTVNNPNTAACMPSCPLLFDGNDVFFGAFGTGNSIGTDGGSIIYPDTGGAWAGASVNFVPEPATASLIVLGLAGMALAGRRKGERR